MRYASSVVIALFLVIGVLSNCTKKAPPPQEIMWASTLEEALKIASEKDQPIIADFWSDG